MTIEELINLHFGENYFDETDNTDSIIKAFSDRLSFFKRRVEHLERCEQIKIGAIDALNSQIESFVPSSKFRLNSAPVKQIVYVSKEYFDCLENKRVVLYGFVIDFKIYDK
jgi:hypothetical protein